MVLEAWATICESTASPASKTRRHVAPRCVQALKVEHPFWGYRRMWAYLHLVEPLPVNKQRVLRLMREHHLLVKLNPKLRANRTPTGSKPRPTQPNEWWGIDMTKILQCPATQLSARRPGPWS
jgi:helix-turn-helix protein